MMKRIFSMIMILMLLAASAQAEWLNNKLWNTDPENDIMSAHVVIKPWPDVPGEGMPILYADDKCIIMPGRDDVSAPVLYDISTGVTTELRSLPEDEALWMEMIARVNFGMPEETVASIVEESGASAAFFYLTKGNVGFTCNYKAGKYVLLQMNAYSLLVDTENAVMRPVGWGVPTEDGTIIGSQVGSTAYTLTAQDGTAAEVTVSADPGYDWNIAGSAFTNGSAVVIVRESMIDREKGQINSVCFIDDVYSGKVTDTKNIGSFPALQGPDQAIACGKDAAIVFAKANVVYQPPILVRRGSDNITVLVWDSGKIAEYPLNEARDDNGRLCIPEGCSFILPLGASADGRYVLFVEGEGGSLVAVDLETMDCRMLLDGTTVYDTMQMWLIQIMVPGSWNGENYINMRGGYTLWFEYE